MTIDIFTKYYKDFSDPRGYTKVKYLDNALGHKVFPTCIVALEQIQTELR